MPQTPYANVLRGASDDIVAFHRNRTELVDSYGRSGTTNSAADKKDYVVVLRPDEWPRMDNDTRIAWAKKQVKEDPRLNYVRAPLGCVQWDDNSYFFFGLVGNDETN